MPDNVSPEPVLPEQPRQFGEAVNTDPDLAQLAQAQSDEEALAIEVKLFVEPDPPLEGIEEEPVS